VLSLRATRQSSHCEAPEGQRSNLALSTQNGDIATSLSALALTVVVGAVVDGEAFSPSLKTSRSETAPTTTNRGRRRPLLRPILSPVARPPSAANIPGGRGARPTDEGPIPARPQQLGNRDGNDPIRNRKRTLGQADDAFNLSGCRPPRQRVEAPEAANPRPKPASRAAQPPVALHLPFFEVG